MPPLLKDLPEIINQVFYIIELLVLRLTLLALATLGACALLKDHLR
jgi:hypothetical protein